MCSDGADSIADSLFGTINMAEGALLQALSPTIVFFVSDIRVSLIEQLHSAM